MSKKVGKNFIAEIIRTDDKILLAALSVIAANQTEIEQDRKATYYKNHVGFRTSHARSGMYDLEYYCKHGDLPVERMNYWRQNLPMYWRQLIPSE